MTPTIEEDVTRRQLLSRLATLRRLHHHVANGGRLQPRDDDYLGEPATKASLARNIEVMERRTA